jgi:hypothetical protein
MGWIKASILHKEEHTWNVLENATHDLWIGDLGEKVGLEAR